MNAVRIGKFKACSETRMSLFTMKWEGLGMKITKVSRISDVRFWSPNMYLSKANPVP